MAGCKRHDLIATTNEERIVRDHQRTGALLNKGHNCRVDVVLRSGPHDIDLLPERSSRSSFDHLVMLRGWNDQAGQ